MTSFDAVLKFWSTPELVSSLFPFLDGVSVSKLAQAHQLTPGVLQDNPANWKILVKRCCPFSKNRPDHEPCWTRWVGDQLENLKTDVKNLIDILKEMKDPKLSTLELLHVICERFPPVFDDAYVTHWSPHLGMGDPGKIEFVQLKCPCPRSPHQVSQLGFLLLEEVEGAFGTAEQTIEIVLL